MQTTQQLKALSDEELLHRLAALLAGSRHSEAELVAHIGEVDSRRLYAREATPSMFVYCLEPTVAFTSQPSPCSHRT